MLYRVILRREADDVGLAACRRQLEGQRPLVEILWAFEESDEFRSTGRMFVPPGHFYSPIVLQRDVENYATELELRAQVEKLPGIDIDLADMLAEFHALLPFLSDVPFQAERMPGLRYTFDNGAYSWADGSILHAMLRRHRPRRLIEVGSGWSSACAIDTIERYLPGACDVTFIEPYPELLKSLVGKTAVNVKTIETPVQRVPVAFFEQLEPGDFLFIDSTHVLKTGSDVCYELFEILPRIKSGVFVHFHDVFWPFEYPPEWVIKEGRSWNEIYALRALLQESSGWKVIFFNDYMARFARSEIKMRYPDFLRNSGGALWLQRCA